MAKAIISLPETLYPPGTRTVTLPDLTTDDNGVRASLTIVSWPDTGSDVLTLTFEASDDGAQWYGLARFSYPGGVHINARTGLPVPAALPTVYWPERNGVPQRPFRARLTATNTAPLTTAITLTGA